LKHAFHVVLYPANMLIKQPASLSVEMAAAAWMQYLTASEISPKEKVRA
jgi:NADPH:quinone reductase-like Zn-dependent oxidoreductase